jgi:Zinc knuckle
LQTPEWALLSVSFNVLDLLELIKSMSFRYEDRKFQPLSLHEVKQNFYSFRQGNLTNTEYLQQFKNRYEVAVSHGARLHDKAVAVMLASQNAADALRDFDVDLTDAEREAYHDLAKDLCQAIAFLSQSDRKRYSELLAELENDYTKGQSCYPPSLVKAYQYLNDYKARTVIRSPAAASVDNAVAFVQDSSSKNLKGYEPWMDDMTCFNCSEKGHISPICPHPRQSDDSDDADDDKKRGDDKKKAATPKKKTTKDKASKRGKKVTKKASFAMQEDGDDEDASDSEESMVGFCNIEVKGTPKTKGATNSTPKKRGGPKSILKKRGTNNKLNLREMQLLDNQSTTDLFCNRKFVTNIRQVKGQVSVKGNGGTLTTNLKADVKGYGEVWFSEDAITNILSMANVTKKFRVTYDSQQDGSFVVHTPKGKILFTKHPDGLHYFDPRARHSSFLQTVDENETGYSKRQLDRAKEARSLYAKVGHPSIGDFKAMIKHNMIMNCPITIDDVVRAEKVYGKNIAALKGKTVRASPSPVVTDYVEVPPEILEANSNIVLTADVFFVNKVPFFMSLSREVVFTTVEHIARRTKTILLRSILKVKNIYNNRDFSIATALMDNEFEPLKADLKEQGITLNTPAAGEHVPEPERRIRVIKERARACRHTLPFEFLPKVMIISLIYNAVLWLNAFPPPKAGCPRP